MRFVKLTAAELITLQQGHKNGSQFQFRDRCFCLLLSHQGKSVTELAQFFGVSRITVYAWFDAWETNGIGGLMNRKGQGRKPILSLQNRNTSNGSKMPLPVIRSRSNQQLPNLNRKSVQRCTRKRSSGF